MYDMILNQQNVLFFLRSTQHGGTENVVLQLCEIFSPLVNNIIVASADGFAINKLELLGIKHYVIPDIENKSLSTIISVSKIIKQIVAKERITIIHTHHRMAAFYVRMLGLNKQCQFINTSHNTFSNKRMLTRYAYSKANIVACGEMVKKNLVDFFGLDNVTVIHNAVKPFVERVIVDDRLYKAKNEGKFLVGNIGRLSEQKGMRFFVQAVPYVIKKHPKTEFFIIGSGEDEDKLKNMTKGLPITFMGYRTDIQNVMCQLDLVVLSSLWEGLPLTPIEAFSVGKTIVATSVDGTLEIVRNNENGLLVEPRKIIELADKICWMMDHPTERLQMEKSALETFKKEFAFSKFAQSYIDFYEGL